MKWYTLNMQKVATCNSPLCFHKGPGFKVLTINHNILQFNKNRYACRYPALFPFTSCCLDSEGTSSRGQQLPHEYGIRHGIRRWIFSLKKVPVEGSGPDNANVWHVGGEKAGCGGSEGPRGLGMRKNKMLWWQKESQVRILFVLDWS